MTPLDRSTRIGPVAALALLPLAAACSGAASDATGVKTDSTTVAVVSIIPASLTLQVGQTSSLSVRAQSAAGTTVVVKAATWSSADASIVRVDNGGFVTGVAPGTTVITATVNGKSAGVSVTVSPLAASQAVFASIAAGGAHTCALTATGKGYCWGHNLYGELGDGTDVPRQRPVAVAGNYTFIRISAGNDHTCALIASGSAYCWGYNFNGGLGDGTTTNRLTPTLVKGGPFFEISAGGLHTCAMDAAGVASCWGAAPAIGDGKDSTRLVPTAVAGNLKFSYIGAGLAHTCGMSTNGVVYCWGSNSNGMLGLDSVNGPILVPTAVHASLTFEQLSTTYSGACAIVQGAGTTYCWGFALPPGRVSVTVPTLLPGGSAYAALGVGPTGNHACALTGAHAAYCWGTDLYGQIGDGGVTGERATPVLVAGGLSWAMISQGGSHTCGLTTTGLAYCWGSNSDGQLGTGNSLYPHAPAPVLAP